MVAETQTITNSITAIETLALLGITYVFPRPSNDPLPINRVHNPRQAVEHVANMFLAYIGALRVRYRHNERLHLDSISRLDRYLDDLISPNVWIKLDDLVKARSRGQKFGEQQLLNPARKTLAERMTTNIQSVPTSLSGVKTQVPAFELNSPSMLHSPAPHSNPLLSSSTPTRHPNNSLPPRPISPNTSSSDLSDNGIGPMRGVPRGPRADPMGKKPRGGRGKRR